MCRLREKQATDSVKWTKNHGFQEQNMRWYREFIWRTERPYVQLEVLLCDEIQQRSAVFCKYCIQTLQSMYFYCCQLAWAVFYSQEWCCSETHLFKPGGT